MKENSKGNLTEGSILKVLTKLALPIMGSAFLATLYNITDMAWVGKLGSSAVAGVGVGGMYLWFASGLYTLARMGGQVYVGQSIGANKKDEAKKYITASLQLILMVTLIYSLIALIFTDNLVGFFKLSTPEAISAANIYIKITCGCIVFSGLNAVLTGLFTAQGNSKICLKANFVGLVSNMILDPILIFGLWKIPALGASGAAIATALAQFISLLVFMITILKDKSESNLFKGISIFKMPLNKYMLDVFKLGIPAAIQSTLYCFFSMMLSRIVVNYGDAAVAVQRVGGQIESVSWNVADGFAAAINAFVSQNFGAKKMDRVKKGYNIAGVIVFSWGLIIFTIFLLFAKPISSLFFFEEVAIKESIRYLIILGIGQALMNLELMSIGAISGLGNTKICSIISIILTGMRIPLAMLLTTTSLGVAGVWWALTISSCIKGIVFYFTFRREHKIKLKEITSAE